MDGITRDVCEVLMDGQHFEYFYEHSIYIVFGWLEWILLGVVLAYRLGIRDTF